MSVAAPLEQGNIAVTAALTVCHRLFLRGTAQQSRYSRLFDGTSAQRVWLVSHR